MKIYSTGEEIFLENRVVIDIADVRSCRHEKDRRSGVYFLIMTLTPEGSDKFSRFTADHIGKRAAIILDNKLLMAPTITGELPGPNIVVGGGRFSEKDANELVRKINGESQ